MRRKILYLFLILLHGCSFNNPFITGEIDKVTVVSYSPYTRHHRAFLSRSDLKIIKNGKKYLYLYHKKNNDLAVLIQRKNTFFLYTLSNPAQKPYTLGAKQGRTYSYVLNYLKSIGYKTMYAPTTRGFVVTVSHKRYKGTKTLLFEAKDYTRLLKLYKNSIARYDANTIKTIKTKLPKSLIYSYYKRYKKQAKTKKQLEQLQIIANKLDIKGPIVAKKSTQALSVNPKDIKKNVENKSAYKEPSKTEENSSWYDFSVDESEIVAKEKQTIQKKPVSLPYTYYLNHTSLDELSAHLLKSTTRKSLSTSEYLALKQREKTMQEKKLLEEGSLEELIAAYKRNKKPKFKQRILSLMKEKQQ